MIHIDPYLNFAGNTEEAFNFYRSVLGGEFTMIQRFKETSEAGSMSDDDGEKIMHIGLPIGNNVLMATDTLESKGDKLVVGNNVALTLSVDSKDEADRIFRELSAEGTVEMAMENTFWGAYFGMLRDKYGVKWMISFDTPKEQPQQ